MKFQQILASALIVLGIGTMGYALTNSYLIFVQGKEAPQLFSDSERKVSISDPQQEQISLLLEEQLSQILPAGSIPQSMNLLSWSLFAGILLFGGGQVAGLGLKALRA